MGDTPEATRRLYREMLMAKTPGERLAMAAGMHDVARRLIIAGLPDDATDQEIRRALLERFYKKDLSEEMYRRVWERL